MEIMMAWILSHLRTICAVVRFDHLNNLSSVFTIRACIVVFWSVWMCGTGYRGKPHEIDISYSLNEFTWRHRTEAYCMYFGQCSYHLQFIWRAKQEIWFQPMDFHHWKRNFWMAVYNVYSSSPIPIPSHCNPLRQYEQKNELCAHSFTRRGKCFFSFWFHFKWGMLMFDVFFIQYLHFHGNFVQMKFLDGIPMKKLHSDPTKMIITMVLGFR